MQTYIDTRILGLWIVQIRVLRFYKCQLH